MGLDVHNKLLRLIRDGVKWGLVVGGWGYLCPTTYSLHCHHQNDCALTPSLPYKYQLISLAKSLWKTSVISNFSLILVWIKMPKMSVSL